jgi:hypothetical protein
MSEVWNDGSNFAMMGMQKIMVLLFCKVLCCKKWFLAIFDGSEGRDGVK